MSKVRRKTNSFATALQDAAKRLAKATKERDAAVSTLAALDVEIPALLQTIAALERQLNPGCSSPVEHSPNKGGVGGSIPSSGAIPLVVATPENLTEDDTLPEPDGQPLTPEE